MSTADIAAEIGSLRSAKNLLGMRVVNIYDVSSKVRALCLYSELNIHVIKISIHVGLCFQIRKRCRNWGKGHPFGRKWYENAYD